MMRKRPRRRPGWLLWGLAPALAVACTEAWSTYDSRLVCADPTNCGAPNCDGTPKTYCAGWSDRWGDTTGSADPSAANGLALTDGGLLLVGYGAGTIDLGLGAPQVFDGPGLAVAWIDADGQRVRWAVAGTGSNADVYGSAVAVGPAGQVYVLGHASDDFTLAPWGAAADGVAADGGLAGVSDGDAGDGGGPSVFLAQIGGDGTPSSILRLNSSSVKESPTLGHALAFAGSRLYIASGGDLWWLDGPTALTPLGKTARTSLSYPSFHAVAVIDGGIVVGGLNHPPAPSPDAGVGFLSVLADGGVSIPPVQLDTAAGPGSFSKIEAVVVASDPSTGPAVFVAGQLNDDTTIPSLPRITIPVQGVSAVFVARFSMSLEAEWVRYGVAVVEDGGQDYRSLSGATLLAVDPQQGVLLGFSFRGRLDFNGGGVIAALDDNGDQDLGLVGFDLSGNFRWARRFGQDNVCLSCMSTTSVPNLLNGLAVAGDGVYLAATVNTTIDFGSGVLGRVGAGDIVLAKLLSSP